jgi:hypothetical protein
MEPLREGDSVAYCRQIRIPGALQHGTFMMIMLPPITRESEHY